MYPPSKLWIIFGGKQYIYNNNCVYSSLVRGRRGAHHVSLVIGFCSMLLYVVVVVLVFL